MGDLPPAKNWEIVMPVLGQMSGFKLKFESQFDILYAIFCFNFSLYWCCSWHRKEKERQ